MDRMVFETESGYDSVVCWRDLFVDLCAPEAPLVGLRPGVALQLGLRPGALVLEVRPLARWWWWFGLWPGWWWWYRWWYRFGLRPGCWWWWRWWFGLGPGWFILCSSLLLLVSGRTTQGIGHSGETVGGHCQAPRGPGCKRARRVQARGQPATPSDGV